MAFYSRIHAFHDKTLQSVGMKLMAFRTVLIRIDQHDNMCACACVLLVCTLHIHNLSPAKWQTGINGQIMHVWGHFSLSFSLSRSVSLPLWIRCSSSVECAVERSAYYSPQRPRYIDQTKNQSSSLVADDRDSGHLSVCCVPLHFQGVTCWTNWAWAHWSILLTWAYHSFCGAILCNDPVIIQDLPMALTTVLCMIILYSLRCAYSFFLSANKASHIEMLLRDARNPIAHFCCVLIVIKARTRPHGSHRVLPNVCESAFAGSAVANWQTAHNHTQA